MLDWYISNELARFDERLRQADAERLVHEALAARNARPRLVREAMLKLGSWLVVVGQRMQERYDEQQFAPTGQVYLLTSGTMPRSNRPECPQDKLLGGREAA